MKPITPDEIRSIPEYNEVRDDLRKRIIALKKHRRVSLGDRISLVFENRETMLWQIHEMVRAEGLTKPEAIAHECETYSQLLPAENELSATLYIEISDNDQIRPWLDKLVGVDECLWMHVGDESIKAWFDPSQYSEERIAAVHYLRFKFTDAQREKFLDRDVPARLEVRHENYEATAELSGETRRSLVEDLAG